MNYYSFMILRYQKTADKINCILGFLSILTLSALVIIIIKPAAPWVAQLCLLFTGWLSWTFIEYMLHRFRDHGHDGHTKSKTVQMHHHHHTHPTEIRVSGRQRTILLFLSMASLGISFILQNYFAFIAGLICGFTWFIFMHYVLHQKWSVKVFPRLHRYHIYHHCKYPNHCHGISVPWWDILFNTTPPAKKEITEKIKSFYYVK